MCACCKAASHAGLGGPRQTLPHAARQQTCLSVDGLCGRRAMAGGLERLQMKGGCCGRWRLPSGRRASSIPSRRRRGSPSQPRFWHEVQRWTGNRVVLILYTHHWNSVPGRQGILGDAGVPVCKGRWPSRRRNPKERTTTILAITLTQQLKE